MESIVEDVEDDRKNEGSPANSQCFKDSGGCDDMSFSISIYHSDVSGGQEKGHHC